MTGDALVPCIAKASTITVYIKRVVVYHNEGFQLPTPFIICEMIAAIEHGAAVSPDKTTALGNNTCDIYA